MRVWIALIPITVLAGLAGMFAFTLENPRDARIVPSALLNRPAPDFVLPPPPGIGRGLSKADFAGAPVSVLNVFASWCIPCRAEHPVIAELAKTPGLPVHGLNYKEKNPIDGTNWLRKYGNPYTAVGMDLSGRTGIDFGVYGVPETFLIDRNGIIRHKHVGPVTTEVIERDFRPRIAELSK